jgi:hypothetical protein
MNYAPKRTGGKRPDRYTLNVFWYSRKSLL